jgi:hypothetical protein
MCLMNRSELRKQCSSITNSLAVELMTPQKLYYSVVFTWLAVSAENILDGILRNEKIHVYEAM